jgi:tetratricopeptide (TPR) repeat protein
LQIQDNVKQRAADIEKCPV